MNGDAIEWAGIGSAECPAVDTYSLFKILIGHRSALIIAKHLDSGRKGIFGCGLEAIKWGEKNLGGIAPNFIRGARGSAII